MIEGRRCKNEMEEFELLRRERESENKAEASSSLTDDVDVDVGHAEPGQVAHSEDARVGHLHFLNDELGPL